jgi:CAAX prenyl protease-like protein
MGMTTTSSRNEAWISHVVPFVTWIFFMQILGDAAGWKYALRSGISLGMLLWMRPWRWDYPPLQRRNLLPAFGIGMFVFAFWVFFETDFMSRFETVHRLYLTLGIQMPWELNPPLKFFRYAPESEGWFFFATRLLGSALVISFIEEFFWRGWLQRWVDKEDFLSVDPPAISRKALWIGALLFASIHQQWVAGLVCGLVYNEFYRRTRDIWAVGIAHAVTNGVLGLYVFWSGKYEFWV